MFCISFNMHFLQSLIKSKICKIKMLKDLFFIFGLKCCLHIYIYTMLKLLRTTFHQNCSHMIASHCAKKEFDLFRRMVFLAVRQVRDLLKPVSTSCTHSSHAPRRHPRRHLRKKLFPSDCITL